MADKKITVLISGSGSNLAAILAATKKESGEGKIPAKVIKVIADRDCAGLEHARRAGIAWEIIARRPKSEHHHFAEALCAAIAPENDLIILAGFLSIIPPALIEKFPRKIINLHPSLLPKFGGAGMYGAKVHEAVLAAGEKESGCTVHYVDQGIDTGRIIAQARVRVLPDDDPITLQKRIQKEEHPLLTQTIAALIKGEFIPSPKLQQIRADIDAIDAQLAELLCARLKLIYQAAQEKPAAENIRLPARIEEILEKVKPIATSHEIDPDYLDLIFRLLIDESIRREARHWQALAKP